MDHAVAMKTGDSQLPDPALAGLEVEALACRRGDRLLFSGLGFTLAAGEALQVEGDNGSGKTSLLRILCGLSRPAEGEVRWRGQAIDRMGEAFNAELLYIGHQNAVKEELSGFENLMLAAGLRGETVTPDACLDALARMGLAGLQELPAAMLSQGQRRRLALSRLLLSHVPLWVLDEPFSALDRKAVAQMQATIERHLADGGSVLMVTHQDVPISAPQRRVRVGAG
ncbi:MAG: cytochrome c biogenesis heme-transporting ATPase CcmA [Gammaproteobacteria bacterium]